MTQPRSEEPALVAHLRATWAGEDLPFHMPGHKAGAGAPPLGIELLGRAVYEADVSELGGFDYLYAPQSGLVDAQAQAAELFGADNSWFLVNGASVGNMAAICSVVGDGDALLVARDSHRSVYAGITLSGAQPIYLAPAGPDHTDRLVGVDAVAVADALAANPGIRAVHVTSPSAYGFSIPVEEIAAAAREHGVPLIVDEAHGTHFALHPRFPKSALERGADVVVHSPHKSLGALTQSALLHQQGGLVDPARVARVLQMLQSSSPSVPLLMSLAVSLDQMATEGTELWSRTLALADKVSDQLSAVDGLKISGATGAPGVVAFDPTKLVVDVHGLGTTGFAAARWLVTHRRIHTESTDLRRLIFSLTPGDDEASAGVLVEALSALAAADISEDGTTQVVSLWPTQAPESGLTPRVAGGRPSVAVPISEAVGEMSAEMIVPYPPGVPLVVAGEVFTSALIASVLQLHEHGCRMVGMSDQTAMTLRCVV